MPKGHVLFTTLGPSTRKPNKMGPRAKPTHSFDPAQYDSSYESTCILKFK